MTPELFTVPGASDKVQLSTAVIAPSASKPLAVVQFVHGMAEHKERYYPVMNSLAEHGFACVICDLRGHGATAKDKNDLGYMGKGGMKGLIDDVHLLTAWARERWPGLKLFLFGHSMGAMIVRSYAKRYDRDIDGMVICGSPSNNPAAGAGDIIASVIGLFKGGRYRPEFLRKISTGAYDKLFRKEGVRNAWLSTNKANVQAYNDDPLCGYTFTVNGYRNGMFRLMKDIYSDKGWVSANSSMPIHFMAGAKDPCIINADKFAQAVKFMREMGYSRVTAKLYPGLRHEILNENGKEDIWADLRSLLESWL